MTPAELFLSCEAFARALRRSVASAVPGDDLAGDCRDLGGRVEHLLAELLSGDPAARDFTCDGVSLDEVIGGFDSGVALGGLAWIAERGSVDEWQVPVRMELELEADRLEQIRLLLGDADLGSLKAHAGARPGSPARWLLRFDLPRAAAPAPSAADETVAAVVAWAAAHPGRPIVGRDWQPLTVDAASDHIRAEVAGGGAVALEETWLDGGDALRLT